MSKYTKIESIPGQPRGVLTQTDTEIDTSMIYRNVAFPAGHPFSKLLFLKIQSQLYELHVAPTMNLTMEIRY